MIPHVEDYRKGTNSFPKDNIPFVKKDAKWHLEYAKAMLQDYATDRCGIAYSNRDKILLNRKFSDGTNSEEPYRDVILEFKRDEQEKKAYTNIDFQIVPVIAQFKSVFLGIVGSNEHRITATSIDPISMSKKLKKKWMYWIKSRKQKELELIDANLGIQQEQGEFLPQTKTELDIFDQMGAFKLTLEEVMEKAMNHGFYVSRWTEEIMHQVNGSFFDNNMASVQDFYDPQTCTVRSRYVDIANLVCQYDKSPTFEKSRYFAEVVNYTVADIQAETGWDEKIMSEISDKFKGSYGNSGSDFYGPTNIGNANGPYEGSNIHDYDNFVIPVLVGEFASTMYEYDTEKVDAGGNKTYFNNSYDRKYNTETRKSITTPIKVWHKFKLVIGTDHIWDTGLQHDIPRPKFEDARSSFHVIKLPGLSLCERAQPHASQIQLFYNQMQNHVAKASPSGLMIDWRALQGVNIGGDKDAHPLELLRIEHQTGDLVYASSTARGTINGGGSEPPRQKPSGITQDIMVFINLIEHHISKIREITGVNDKGASIPGQTATGAKLSFMATDISLKTLYHAYLALLKETAINAAARLRDLLAYSAKARDVYEPILGVTQMELLDLVKDLPTANIAIKIEVKLKDEDKDNIRTIMANAMAPGKNGLPALKVSEALLLERCIESGNLKFAQMYIASKEVEREKLDLLAERENQTLNKEIGIEIENTKAKNEAAKLKMTTDEQIRLKEREAELQAMADARKYEHEKELIILKATYEKPAETKAA